MAELRKAARLVLDADAAAAEAARPYAGSLSIRALGVFAGLGDQPPMRFLCGSVLAVGLIGGDRRLVRAGARMLAAHTLATLAKDFVKHRVDRTRPRAAPGKGKGKDHKPRPGGSEAKDETSFPSGHSAGAIAVARAFSRDYSAQTAPALAAGTALALAQIPRCAHYPTDVGAGIAIGLASEALVDAAFRFGERRLRGA